MEIDPSKANEPALARPGRFRLRLVGWLVGGVIASILGAAAYFGWPTAKVSVEELAIEDEEWREPLAEDPGYVGPEACAACHARRVAEHRATSHFRACRLPSEDDMPPGFEPGKGVHRTHDPSLRFEMTHTKGHYFQTAVRTTLAGEVRSTKQINLVYGAAKADEVFFSWQGDRLSELLTAWLHPQNNWGNSPYDRHVTESFTREVTPRCVECHNTWVHHVPGTRNHYKRDGAILGITCERCHGPGQKHVNFHQANPEATTGHGIVQPALLTRERRLEVCTQCHSNTPKVRGPAFSYRPGRVLETDLRTSRSKYPEQDHVANQIQYLRESKCFQKSDMLICTTCHDPHRPNNTLAVQNACSKCHQATHCGDRARLPVEVRGDCVACHMPQRVWMNVHFHTSDDHFVPPVKRHVHRIGVHPMAREEVLLAWHRKRSDAASVRETARLEKTLVEYWLGETEARRRDHRFVAAIGTLREALQIAPTPALRARLREAVATQDQLDANYHDALHDLEQKRFPQAIANIEKVLAVKPDHALAHGKLGSVYAILGQQEQARKHLRAVAQHDPDAPYGYMMLAWLSYLEGNAAEAVEDYRRADAIEPFNSKTHYHWGLALMKLERWAEASELFSKTLTIDPNHAGAFQGMGHALRREGQPAKALRFARRAAELTHSQNADILLTLAEIQTDLGRFADAESTLTQALAAARESGPQLVPPLRKRIEEIRARGKPRKK